jgi:putative ABC transport system permease protein
MILLRYGIKSLLARKVTALAAALGVALVTFVLSAALMLATGVESTVAAHGRNDVVLVLRKGSATELTSVLQEQQVRDLQAMRQLTVSSAETIMVLAMQKVGAPGLSNVTVRGIGDSAVKVRQGLHVTQGRRPTPGTSEAMVGARINGRFQGLALGEHFDLRRNRPVTVVGIFDDGGSAAESEVWMDDAMLKASFARGGTESVVRAQLSEPAAFEEVRRSVEGDLRLGLTLVRETEYLRTQSEGLTTFLTVMGWIVTSFFAVGAVIGAMMTMHAAVASRTREIGTLRALGFSRLRVLSAFTFESAAMTGLGGLVGALLATLLGFVRISMMNYATWSELVFSFSPTPRVLLTAAAFGVLMGLVGGIFPAIRATRISPLAALRQ